MSLSFHGYQPSIIELAFEAFKDAVQTALVQSPLEGVTVRRNLVVKEALGELSSDTAEGDSGFSGFGLMNLVDNNTRRLGELSGADGYGEDEIQQLVRLEWFVRARDDRERQKLLDWGLSILGEAAKGWATPPSVPGVQAMLAPVHRVRIVEVLRGLFNLEAAHVQAVGVNFGLELTAPTLLG